MTVWIANPFDSLPLEGNRPQRYWLLARAFARAGHDVTLWTSDFSHARKARRAFPGADAAARTVVRRGEVWPCGETPGFRVALVRTPAYRRNVGLARVWSHRAFARRWRAWTAEEAPPDVLVTSLPPLALGAAVRRAARTLWVVDVMDAWPETFERLVPRALLAPLRRVAGRIYRGADAVAGVAERYVALARAYGATCPTRVFHHGIARAGGAPAAPAPSASRCRLVYVGNMGASYDLDTVVEAVKGMADVTLDLAGSGPDEAALRARAAGCPRIRFHGYLGDVALRDLLAGGDAALVPLFDASCVGVPYKLADYAAAGLPVLNTLHGETERLLAAHGAGLTYRAGDAAAFRDALARLRARDAAALRAGARRLAATFDADAVYPAYVAWVEGLAAGKLKTGKEEGGRA